MEKPFLMKGKVWSKRKDKMTYPCVAEVKYDEIRCHVTSTGCVDGSVEFLSYEGKQLCNMEFFEKRFSAFMKENRITDLDIGILVNGNFNDSFRWVRSSSGIPDEKVDKKTGKIAPSLYINMVEFYLFDLPVIDYLSYEYRILERAAAVLQMKAYEIPTKEPELVICTDESEVDAAFLAFRERGFEGAMVKSLDHKYQVGKRIDGWLKMKPEEEADGKIVGFIEAVSEDGVPHGRVGSIMVECEDGSKASPAGLDHGLAKLMFENQADYLGDWLMFKYMERDRAGGYRHPIFGRLRESKEFVPK